MRTVSPRAASNEGGLSPRSATAGVSSPSPRVTAVSASAVATAEAAAGNGGSEAGTKGGSGHSSSSREGSRCGIIQSDAGREAPVSRGGKVVSQTTGLTLLHVRKAGRSVVNGLYEQHVHGAADGVAKWVHKRAPCVLLRYAMADGTFPSSSSCTPNDAS